MADEQELTNPDGPRSRQTRLPSSDDPIAGPGPQQQFQERAWETREIWEDGNQTETDGSLDTARRQTPGPINEDFENDRITSIPSPPSNTNIYGCEVRTPQTGSVPQRPTHNMSQRRSNTRDNAVIRGRGILTGPAINPISVNALSLRSLPTLDKREDYLIWERQLKLVIDLIGAEDLLSVYDTEDKVPESQLGAWKSKQRQCVGILKTTLSISLSEMMTEENTVKRVFQRAKEEFQESGLGALQTAYREWEECALTSSESVREFAQKIKTIQEKFLQAGSEHKLPNSHLILKFVNGLGEQYLVWCTNFWTSYSVEAFPTLDSVIRSAEAEEVRQKSGVINSQALIARKRSAPIDDENSVLIRVPRCTHCGKTGHARDGCYDLFPEKKKRWEERKNRRSRRPNTNTEQKNQESSALAASAATKTEEDLYGSF